jgi:hypothetical protein
MAAQRDILPPMVRRDVMADLSFSEGRMVIACCASAAGASPVPVSIGAPGSRPQVLEGDLCARAGYHKPVRGRKPRNGERTRGPQHQVKPAASTQLQPGGRADHVTAKATLGAREPKLASNSGGVWGAARVTGGVWNTRDPSARPWSWQGDSYKPMAKASTVQRESEGIVVPHNPERSGGRTPRRTTWREGGVPGVIEPMEQVSAREWPA